MAKQNIFDNEVFFDGYKKLRERGYLTLDADSASIALSMYMQVWSGMSTT